MTHFQRQKLQYALQACYALFKVSLDFLGQSRDKHSKQCWGKNIDIYISLPRNSLEFFIKDLKIFKHRLCSGSRPGIRHLLSVFFFSNYFAVWLQLVNLPSKRIILFCDDSFVLLLKLHFSTSETVFELGKLKWKIQDLLSNPTRCRFKSVTNFTQTETSPCQTLASS